MIALHSIDFEMIDPNPISSVSRQCYHRRSSGWCHLFQLNLFFTFQQYYIEEAIWKNSSSSTTLTIWKNSSLQIYLPAIGSFYGKHSTIDLETCGLQRYLPLMKNEAPSFWGLFTSPNEESMRVINELKHISAILTHIKIRKVFCKTLVFSWFHNQKLKIRRKWAYWLTVIIIHKRSDNLADISYLKEM